MILLFVGSKGMVPQNTAIKSISELSDSRYLPGVANFQGFLAARGEYHRVPV
jgi:hypothetical protein